MEYRVYRDDTLIFATRPRHGDFQLFKLPDPETARRTLSSLTTTWSKLNPEQQQGVLRALELIE